MNRIAAALAVLSLAAFVRATEPAKTDKALSAVDTLPDHGTPSYKGKFPPMKTPDNAVPQDKDLRISFKLRFKDLHAEGNFVTESGTQANYVQGGEVPWETSSPQGKGIEFKKYGVIVNVLPFIKPDAEDVVDAQMQIELSGPVASKNSLNVPEIATFQLQNEFSTSLGKTVVLVDEPDRRIEVTIAEAK